MFQTLFFDVDNTLLDFHASAGAALQIAFSEQDIPWDASCHAVFEEVNQRLWKKIEDGELTREGLYAVRFFEIFEQLGIKADAARAELRFRAALAESAVPVKGAERLLRDLYPHHTLCVASNAFYRLQRGRLLRAGLLPYFTHLFTSVEMGDEKPRPAFFDGCFSRLRGVRPAEVLLIGDSLNADMRGAAAYGLSTCWYNPAGLPAPADIRCDHIIASLDEVKNIV